jgi:hypothetical protein
MLRSVHTILSPRPLGRRAVAGCHGSRVAAFWGGSTELLGYETTAGTTVVQLHIGFRMEQKSSWMVQECDRYAHTLCEGTGVCVSSRSRNNTLNHGRSRDDIHHSYLTRVCALDVNSEQLTIFTQQSTTNSLRIRTTLFMNSSQTTCKCISRVHYITYLNTL